MKGKQTVRGPSAYVCAASQAQALAAARAVHECRVIVQRNNNWREDALDRELYDFEMHLYRLADRLAARPRKGKRHGK